MGGKGDSGKSKDYYGDCAGIVCQGQLDFVWGVLMNNDLVWPHQVKLWDYRTYPAGRSVIWTNGSVYKTSVKTSVDPNAFPWVLLAAPWVAGTYHTNDMVLYVGNVWKAIGTTAATPPAAPVTPHVLDLQGKTSTNNWVFVSTPDTWSGGTNFWNANSITAWKGRLWTNSSGTKNEPPNAPWSLWKIDRATSANPLKFTIPGGGDVFLYWGTAGQNLDTSDEKFLNNNDHPAYRNKAVFAIRDFLFGTMQSSPPSFSVMGGRNPVQTLITGAAAALDADWQANPWCVLAEMLTHPVIGLGLPNSFFDATSWQAEADRCYANPQLYYISPMFDSLKKVREVVADIMSYPDAFIFWSVVATLIAGHWPHHEAAPAFTGANTVDRDALVEELDWSSGTWGDTYNSVQVSFQDVQAGFKDRPAFANNLFNQNVVKRLQSLNISRPHIVRFNQATAWAIESAKLAGDQAFKGELKIRAEKATGVTPGSIFLLTDDVLGLSQAQRCTRRVISGPPEGRVSLSHETEKGLAPQPYSPTRDNPEAPLGPPPTKLGNFAVCQLPSALGPSSSIALLAGRTNDVTTSVETFFKEADAASFQSIGITHNFAVPASFFIKDTDEVNMPNGDSCTIQFLGAITNGNTYTLTTKGFWRKQVFYSAFVGMFPFTTATEGVDYSVDVDSGTITILTGGAITTGKFVEVKMWDKLVVGYDTNTPQIDMDSVLSSLTDDEIQDGQCLLFAFRADNPALFEIMSVRGISAAGTVAGKPYWFVQVFREYFGTPLGGDGSYSWGTNANDVMFIMRKGAITPLTHESFQGFHDNLSTINLRICPTSAWVESDIDDIYDPAVNPQGLTETLDYTWASLYASVVDWVVLEKNAVAIASFSGSFASTDVFNFGFQIDCRDGNLTHASLIAYQGQQEIVLWATNVSGASQLNRSVQFSLTKGNWVVELRTLDGAGNQTTTPLTFGGDPVTIYVDSATATAPKIFTLTSLRRSGYVNHLLFGILPSSTGGYAVHYQITARDVAPSGGAWITCGIHSTVSFGKTYDDPAFGYIPPIAMGSAGQTLWAYASKTAIANSAVVKWNF